jgi:predicted nucleotide-binding protein (sugar kinase/HSP70/actin superfamily)
MKKAQKDTMDIKMLNQFFIELYDMLYHYIIFDKIKIAKKLVRLLEELALPLNYTGEHKWVESFKKLKKMKL